MSEYFSHDYDSREDEKIQELIFKLGMEGYGIYWGIVEMLYKNDGYMQTQCERIAHALHTHNDKIKSVIFDFNLFQINGNAFTSKSVLHRLKLRKGKSFAAQKAAKVRWNKVKAEDANAMRTQCERNAKKKRKEKERKVNKNKENIRAKLLFKNSNITLEDIEKAFQSTEDISNADARHYFNSMLDWSESNKEMKADWIATARAWARKDLAKGELKIKSFGKHPPINF